MHVEIIESGERFIEIETDWDELYRRDPSAHVYLSSRYISSILIRLPGRFRVLLAWTDDGSCVGALPIYSKTKWSRRADCLINELDMLGHVFDADYTGVLCHPDHEVAVCEAFAHSISKMTFAQISLSFFRVPKVRLDAFCRVFEALDYIVQPTERKLNDGKTNNLVCPYVDLAEDFDAYLASLSASRRQKIRKLLRQLKDDPDLHVTRSRPETYKQDCELLSELWFLQYAGIKGQRRAKNLAVQFRDVLGHGLASGMVALFVLWRAGRPVAAQANYIDYVKGHALFHVGARDKTVNDLAIGLTLQAHCIRWAVAQGLKRYDFTLGDEPYKYGFGAVDHEIFSIEIITRDGTNNTGQLDTGCREDTAVLLERFARRGREDRARTAATQALAVWPDLDQARHIERLLSDQTRHDM